VTHWQHTSAGRHLAGRAKTNTRPEVLLRRALHAQGARYRLHVRLAKGCTPDLILPRRRLAVFADGCFWHSCPKHGRKAPFTGPNAALWEKKMRSNRERDDRASRIATDMGWRVVRIWECQIVADPGAVAQELLAVT
jgi:DNA mismatch endonuclease (patch repair protein)